MPRGYRMGLLLLGDSPSVPDGSTVTPINDVPTWLKCAGISTTTYTTLAEVLANASLLRVLINSENAMDYLVRCKEWTKQEALVPTMTSNTTPSGIASASSEASTIRQAWKGFAGESANGWMPSESSYPAWIQYKFDAPTLATNLKVLYKNDSGTSYTQKVEISASNDGTNWTTLATNVLLNSNNTYTDISFTNDNKYLYYRMTLLSGSGAPQPLIGSGYLLQFYSISEGVTDNSTAMQLIGANDYASNTLLNDSTWLNAICNSAYFESVLNVKVPTMTSATTPSGEVIAYGESHSDYPYWRAFDGTSAHGLIQNVIGNGLGYIFTNNVSIKMMLVIPYWSGDTYKLQVSSDGTNWTDVATTTGVVTVGSNAIGVNSNSVPYARCIQTTKINNNNYQEYTTIQFYGREKGGVQSWLLAAGITNKNYTTVSQVLADSDLLPVLIASHSGMDYLATCIAFANEICANETAMQLIGADNYAADTLLADETWLNAICNSTYFESVLNVKVPTMTSDTTPSGECFANPENGTYPAWKAYTNNNSEFSAVSSGVGNYIGYEFAQNIKLYKMKLVSTYTNGVVFKLQQEISGSWTDVTSFTATGPSQNTYPSTEDTVVVNAIENSKFRLYQTNSLITGNLVYFTIQFYGRVDV